MLSLFIFQHHGKLPPTRESKLAIYESGIKMEILYPVSTTVLLVLPTITTWYRKKDWMGLHT